MTQVDVKLITRILTIACGGLIIALSVYRFVKMDWAISRVNFILMTINMM